MRSPTRRVARAQATIEVAIVLPLLMVLVLGMLSLAWAMFQYQTLQHVAQSAARAALSIPQGEIVFSTNPNNKRCETNDVILNAAKQSALVAGLEPGAKLCIGKAGPPTNSCAHAPDTPNETVDQTDWLYLDPQPAASNINLCINVEPSAYTPGCVTAYSSQRIAPLGPVAFLRVTIKQQATLGIALGCAS